MTLKTLVLVLGMGILTGVGAPSRAQIPSREVPLRLEDLERLALENNPTLVQAARGVEAAQGRARQAGLFPNPTIGYIGEEISRGPIIRGGEHGFFVEQRIPLGGKLGLSRRVFAREVTQAEAIWEAQRYRVLNSVRSLYYETLVAARRVEVHERLAQLATEAVGVSRQLFNVGAADRPDILESEIEARQSQLALTAARNGQFRTWLRLAAVIGDSTFVPRPLVGSLEAPVPELIRDQVLENLLRESPAIKAARAAAARSELALRRARREPVPDLFLRGGPRYNRELLETGPFGTRPVGWEGAIEVGLTIPLFNRNQGNIAAAQAELARSQAELRRVQFALRAQLANVFDEYLTSLRAVERYRTDILPRAEEAHTLFQARFREMAAAYPQVLIARRTLFQVTEQYLTTLGALWRAVVQIQGFLLMDGLGAPPRAGEIEGSTPGLEVEAGVVGGVRTGNPER